MNLAALQKTWNRLYKVSFFVKLLILLLSLWLVLYCNKKNQKLNTISNLQSSFESENKTVEMIFIGGLPGFGTELMRALLDVHPLIRCGKETHVVMETIKLSKKWLENPKRLERLENAGIKNDVVDLATRSFMLEIISKNGKHVPNLCYNDAMVFFHSKYIEKLFPNAKFILMIRDARASVHSNLMTMKDINYTDAFKRWNTILENMYSECIGLGKSVCLPVYYEQLVLHPEQEIHKIFRFLKIEFNDAVLNVQKEVSANLETLNSWFDHIPDDVLDNIDNLAPMLSKLGYDTKSKKPNYILSNFTSVDM